MDRQVMNFNTHQRLHYLDAARVFALLLGIVFHASLSFMPIYIGWAVMDISTSAWVSSFVLVSHSFRMELFFFVAGYFSVMSLTKQRIQAFLYSRTLRLLVPFILGSLVLKPLLLFGWTIGAESMRGEAHVAASLEKSTRLWIEQPSEFFVGSHLWFLYYLLLLSALLIVAQLMAKHAFALLPNLNARWNALFNMVCRYNIARVTLPAITVLILTFMTSWSVDTPNQSLVPNLPVLTLYGVFFFAGGWCFTHPLHLQKFTRITVTKVCLCILATSTSLLLSRYEMQQIVPLYTLYKGIYLVCYSVMMWLLVSLLLGVTQYFFAQRNAVTRYLADASYWLYLIHLPIVIVLQVAFAEVSAHWAVKLTAISLLTSAFTLLCYDLLVRPSRIGLYLNGKQQPSRLLQWLLTSRLPPSQQ